MKILRLRLPSFFVGLAIGALGVHLRFKLGKTSPSATKQPAIDKKGIFLDQFSTHREQSHVWLTSMIYALVLALAVGVGRDLVASTIDSGKAHITDNVSLLIALCVVFAEVVLIYSEVMFGIRFLRGVAGAFEVVLPALIGVAQAAQIELIDSSIRSSPSTAATSPPQFWLLGFGVFAMMASVNIGLMKRALKSSSLPSSTKKAVDIYQGGLSTDQRSSAVVGVGALAAMLVLTCYPNEYALITISTILFIVLSATVGAQARRRRAVFRQLQADAETEC